MQTGCTAKEIHVFQKEIDNVIKNDEKGTVTAIHDESIVIAVPRARKHGYARGRIRALYMHGFAFKDHSVRTAYHLRQENVQTIRQV